MTDAAQRLIGAWRVVSISSADPDNSVVDGLIIYDASGFMSAHILLDGVHHTYFGAFSVDPAAAAVTHHRVVNTQPGLPTDVVRQYRFVSDDELVLTPDNAPGVDLTFRRVARDAGAAACGPHAS